MGIRTLFSIICLLLCTSLYANGITGEQATDQTALQLTPVRVPVSSIRRGPVVTQQYDPNRLFSEPDALQQQAYKGLTDQAMPMTPEQILQLKEMRAVTQRAAAASIDTPPKPVLSSRSVNLTPGANPPTIRLQQGFVTSIVFVDGTGADWPIASYDLGNSQAFDIQWERDSNTLMIQATSMYTYGNLAVTLRGLSTPVMLTLVPGQKVVDYRVDLHIQHAGPNAVPTRHMEWGPVSDVLLNVLDGIPPQGAQELQASDDSCHVWLSGDKMYVRTKLTILSPSWLNKTTSSDGTNAYEMQRTPTIIVSKYGNPVEVSIEGM